MSNEATSLALTNATIVLPDRLIERGTVVTRERVIEEVLEQGVAFPHVDRTIDLAGAYLMPGMIDLHNDSLETEVNPRPESDLDIGFALANLERRLALSGVTTEFHAISFMNFKHREVDQADRRAAFVAENRNDGRLVDHQVLHRLDVWTPESMDAVFASLHRFERAYVSLNDHTPGQGQYRDIDGLVRRMEEWAVRRGTPFAGREDYVRRMKERGADHTTVPMVYERVRQEKAVHPGMVVATHDDDSPEKVERQFEIGATIGEFPITIEAAKRGRELGMLNVVGAPNIVRGGSSSGNLDARDLFQAGLADIVCADYHAPSMLPAVFRLVREGLIDLPGAVKAVTATPAKAVGLMDRGAIEPGLNADLIVVQAADIEQLPEVTSVVRNGREVVSVAATRVAVTV